VLVQHQPLRAPRSADKPGRPGPVHAVVAACALAILLGVTGARPASAQQTVTPETFIRTETDRMFRDISLLAGGVNRFHHIRRPTPLDEQVVIRMNRDTLYSGAVIDVTAGATITVPAIPDGRYASVLIIDNDHYTPVVFHDAGVHEIPADTDHMFAAVRIQLYDPGDADEVALINALQDQFVIAAGSDGPLPEFDWDTASLDALRAQYEAEAANLPNLKGMMGPRGKVNEDIRHIAAASAWGLFPEWEAMYLNYFGGHGTDRCFAATFEVPENRAFWSITMYGATGFIECERSLLNSSNVVLNADGTFTGSFGSEALCGDVPNRLDTPEGWNFMMRIYLPGPSVLDGSYVLPRA
jgi:hypothetical protein